MKREKTGYTGNLPEVTDFIKALEHKKAGNHFYTLRCIITNKDGARFAVSRELAIGYFDGDSK